MNKSTRPQTNSARTPQPEQPDLFGLAPEPPAPPSGLEALRRRLHELAVRGVYLGTSSWKYPGWCGKLYTRERYFSRGQFSEARFNRECLAEYATVFKTVGVDAAYYQFPTPRYLETLFSQVPPDFLFAFKVTDEITIKRFANLPRFGERAGQPNPNFLNADLFTSAFLKPFEPYQDQVALFMFEFSRFYPSDFARGRDFVEALDKFLEKLPKGWPYGVEIRNRGFLRPEYFATLARHGVVHIYNSWTQMPPVHEQIALPGSRTHPDICAARFLLKPGRTYEEAVKQFSPYERIQDPYPEGRRAAAELIQQTLNNPGTGRPRAYLYFNNRFEGNAIETIELVLDEAGLPVGAKHD